MVQQTKHRTVLHPGRSTFNRQRMNSVEGFREFVSERLSSAAEEIFRVFEETVLQYEEEVRRLLESNGKPGGKILDTGLPEEHACQEEEEEAAEEQQRCNKEILPSLDQEDREAPNIKEEEENLCISEDRGPLALKQEADTYMVTVTYDEDASCEAQALYLNPEEEDSINMSEVAEGNTDQQHFSDDSDFTENQDGRKRSNCDIEVVFNSTKPGIPCETHTSQRNFSCETCGKVFRFKSRLITHLRVHTGERPYACDICGKSFTQAATLKSHRSGHTDEKRYRCSTCGKCLKSEANLVMHMKVHTNERPHACPTCEKRFIRKSILNNHMRTHTEEKPFPCTTCGKRFHFLSDWKYHIRIHTGEKPFSCETCGKDFRSRGDLSVHMRSHTGETPYRCDACGQTFQYHNNFLAHVRNHAGVKPYQCDTCGKTFTVASGLANHKKTHAGN